jgi:uncharacterized protein YndB with AHSA1/START domain
MEDITDSVVVNAPADRVWRAIQDPREHAQWHPLVLSIDGDHAPGATRVCAVSTGKTQGTTEETCSSYDEGRKIMWTIERDSSGFSRMVSDWSAGFSLEPQGASTRVTAKSLFRPRRLFVRLMLPMIRRKFHAAQRDILNGLKQHVEAK